MSSKGQMSFLSHKSYNAKLEDVIMTTLYEKLARNNGERKISTIFQILYNTKSNISAIERIFRGSR